jgi:hypothetical protein
MQRFPCPAFLVIGGPEPQRIRVTLLGESAQRFRARIDEDATHIPWRLPRGAATKGDIVIVPKGSCVIGDPNAKVQP